MTSEDIDLYELNEAFASVVLRMMQALDIPHEKMNVNGGAIAMGHPLGATGGMILGTMLDELERIGQGNRADHAVRRRRHGHGHGHRARLMQIGEAKISALAVSALTGVGLTLMLNQALRDLGFALVDLGAGDAGDGRRCCPCSRRTTSRRAATSRRKTKPPKATDMKLETFSFDVDADGIALATFDVPGRSMNTLTAQAIADLGDHRRGSGDQRDDQGPGHHLGQDERLLRRRGPWRAWRRIGRRRRAAAIRKRS